MLIGTAIAMVGAYLFQLIVGRALGPEDFAPITVLWTIQFLIATTVFIPIEQLTVRRLAVPQPDRAPWGLYTAVIAVSAGSAVVFSAATLDRLFQGNAAYLPIVGALIAAQSGETTVSSILGCLAIIFATVNVVGGFLVTDRMLQKFKSRD